MSATGRDEVAGTVAVIGLGSMGFGMAQSLRRKGLDVVGCDVNAAAVQALRLRRRPWRRHTSRGRARRRFRRLRRRQCGADRDHPFRRRRGARDPAEGRRRHLLGHHGPEHRAQNRRARGGDGPPLSRRAHQRWLRSRRQGRAHRHGLGLGRGVRRGASRARCHGDEGLPARRHARHRRRLQDDQPAPDRRAHRRRLRGHDARRQAGARPRQGLRGDHGVGRQLLDVREPHAARAERRLHAHERGRDLRQGLRHRPGHRAHRALSRPRSPPPPCRCSSPPPAPAWAATTTARSPASTPSSPAPSCRARLEGTGTGRLTFCDDG